MVSAVSAPISVGILPVSSLLLKVFLRVQQARMCSPIFADARAWALRTTSTMRRSSLHIVTRIQLAERREEAKRGRESACKLVHQQFAATYTFERA